MDKTESSTKMVIDTNGSGENKDAEPGKSTTLTTTEVTAVTKDGSSLMPSAPSAPSDEGMVSVEETATASSSLHNDSAFVTSTTTNSISITSITTDGVTATSSPKAAPIAGGTITSTIGTGEKIQSEKSKGAGITTNTGTTMATDSGATAPVVSSTLAKTTVKPKPSPTGNAAGPSKAKTSSTMNPKVVKSSTTKIVSKNSSGATKTATNTKSLKKGARKKRKISGLDEAEEKGGVVLKKKKVKRKKEKEDIDKPIVKADKSKKIRKQTKKASSNSGNSGSYPYADHLHALPGLSAAQMAVQEQMRKALEEDQYSANGSIVDTDTDDDEHQYMYKGQSIRLDRAYLLQAAKKCGWLGDASAIGSMVAASGIVSAVSKDGDMNYQYAGDEEGILNEDGSTNNTGSISKKRSSKNKKKGRNQYTNRNNNNNNNTIASYFRIDDKPNKETVEVGKPKNIGFIGSTDKGADTERDEGSIFGQTTGSSNSTWVECDKCKKWRRLRGVVDHSKLPKKWYCSMNRNDPERARCSAPEEEYDAPHTPESAADARTRKHLRVWVRRLQCNEQYESRLPTLTRGKKRSVASSSKEPHEWIRCCNPSCGKWRAILRIMDAKQNVIDRTSDGEWYCVMNTWDEKTASCAAPQENLPAVGCPPWVLQDES